METILLLAPLSFIEWYDGRIVEKIRNKNEKIYNRTKS